MLKFARRNFGTRTKVLRSEVKFWFHVDQIDYSGEGYAAMLFCSTLVSYRVEEQTVSAPITEFIEEKLVTPLVKSQSNQIWGRSSQI